MSAKELIVFAVAKDLCKYVFEITDKSPKKFRFSLVSRMQNLAMEVVEKLFRANEIMVGIGPMATSRAWRRTQLQRDALSAAKLLGFMGLIAQEQKAVTEHQYEVMSRYVANAEYLIKAWLRKDMERYRVECC